MRRLVPSLLAAIVAAGCAGPAPTQPAATRRPTGIASASPEPRPTTAVVPPGGLTNPGTGIVANNGGNLIGRVTGPAGIIANNGAGYRLGYRLNQAAGLAQAAYANALVTLLDAKGAPVPGPDGQPLTATTDAAGNYAFTASLPAKNLLVEVALPDGRGSLRAVAPRGGGTADVDLVSTLTTGYIVSQYVRSQADPLATFERLPADVEAETRAKAKVAVEAAPFLPERLTDPDVVAAVDALRKADPTLDGQLETVKKLLIVAGASELGDGLPATTVTIKHVDDLAAAPDGTLYILTSEDARVWRLGADGILRTAMGDRGKPDGQDLGGKKGTAASLDFPRTVTVDAQNRPIVTEARGAYRLEADGTLKTLATLPGLVAVTADGDTTIAVSKYTTPLSAEPDEETGEYLGGQTVLSFHRCVAGQSPQKLFEFGADPEDWGEPRMEVKGAAWDGADTLHYVVLNGYDGTAELRRRTLSTGATTATALGAGTRVKLDGRGNLFHEDGAGQLLVRNVLTGGADQPVPPPPPTLAPQAFARAGDGTLYGSRYGVVYKLAAGAEPVRVAGTEGEEATGDASAYTFFVLSDCAVTAAGDVYAYDAGRGGIYKVDAQRQISRFGDAGGGNVQMLRTSPTGAVWMSDGDGTGIGQFDASGTWVKKYTLDAGLLVDFVIAPDGSAYAASWITQGDRKFVVKRLVADTQTVIYEGAEGLTLAFAPDGKLHMATEGKLMRRDGEAWTTLKADDRFRYGVMLGTAAGMAFDKTGRLYVAKPSVPTIFRYDLAADTFTTIAGAGGKAFTGTGTDDGIKYPHTPGFDGAGNLYFADTQNRQVKRIEAKDL